jgi:hypothetical protein
MFVSKSDSEINGAMRALKRTSRDKTSVLTFSNEAKMTILYKLTDADGYTRRGETNECLWGPGVTHSGTGKGELCGPGYIHAYQSPLLAILLNPIHAVISNPRLWECDGEIVKNDRGLKCGSISLTTIKEIDIPAISTEQKIKFAI